MSEEEARDTIGTAVGRMADLGATVVGPVEQRGEYWVVMQDPEGNEFCVQ
jgi:predicted enzyme related to lactoylglutathione lyase